jgi:hypothetical protein
VALCFSLGTDRRFEELRCFHLQGHLVQEERICLLSLQTSTTQHLGKQGAVLYCRYRLKTVIHTANGMGNTKKREFLDLQDESITVLRNVGYHSPNDTASRTGILESSATPVRQPQVSHLIISRLFTLRLFHSLRATEVSPR